MSLARLPSLGSILLLMALGLAIVFGLMGVINMAHGELMALGAYATFVVFAWRDRVEDIIPADVVARIDRANRSERGEAFAEAGATA